MPRTLFEKIWDSHVIPGREGEADLLHIDLHLVQEVSSPQAFDGLRDAGRRVRRPDLTIATIDHAIPTENRGLPIADDMARAQVEALIVNVREFDVPLIDLDDPRQGIVHMIGPELGATQPGMTVVCGDSHTSTHGAFGALAFGIGTSEVEHVLATQVLPIRRPLTFAIDVIGELPFGCTSKDLILGLINAIGTSGGRGHVIEYRGEAIRKLSMEARMTVCNMSVEAGARAGMIAPDEVTFAYLHGREMAPSEAEWDAAVAAWRELATDEGATFDKQFTFDLATLEPTVTYGTNPGMSVPVTGRVPERSEDDGSGDLQRALDYMGLDGGEAITDLRVDRVFIGSCTNARIEDLQDAARIVKGQRVDSAVRAMIVPGSTMVKLAAEAQGLDRVFIEAGFEWREAGCSMCVGINPDILAPGERCASTSNRNFEGRQGQGGRTHLVSPAMAAAAAIHGRFVDVRELAR
jgi:3-isopropylmalate/(R)-2-methylmalate dehydratase large subunit